MNYTIGEIAKLLGLAPSTLRYYEKEQLLPFATRSTSGIRIFNDHDFESLKVIECLKATGMQLKDIKKFVQMVALGDDTIDDRLTLFEKRKAEVKKQLQELEITLETINYKCWYYKTAKTFGSSAAVESLDDKDLPNGLSKIRRTLKNQE